MKSLLLTIALALSVTAIQAQEVDQIIKTDIRVQATTQTIKKGLEKLENKCAITPVANCNKGKAFAYYILSGRYYNVANTLIGLDAVLQQQAVDKATALYNKASLLLPEDSLTAGQKYLLLDQKSNYEAAVN